MANVDFLAGFRTSFFESFTGISARLKQASKDSFALKSNDGRLKQTFSGDFALTKNGRIRSGKILSFSVLIDNQPAWTVSDLDLGVNSYNNLFTSSKKVAFDLLFGGADSFLGSDESDSLFSYAGDDSINANGGNDSVNAGIGNDNLNGGEGNDILFGDDGEDILNGEEGLDQLDGGVGADLLTGGLGADLFITRDGSSPQLTAIQDNQGLVTLFADNGIDVITDFDAFDSISANGRIFSPPLSFDFTSPGDPVFLQGNWQEDILASGSNRGKFELDSDVGSDLLFFIATPEFIQNVSDQGIAFPDPSALGSQLFVLLGASRLLA